MSLDLEKKNKNHLKGYHPMTESRLWGQVLELHAWTPCEDGRGKMLAHMTSELERLSKTKDQPLKSNNTQPAL